MMKQIKKKTVSPPLWMSRKASNLSPEDWRLFFEDESEAFFELFDETKIQDAESVRNLILALFIADDLIDPSGGINLEKLESSLEFLRERQFCLSDQRESFSLKMSHMCRVLSCLKEPILLESFHSITKGAGLGNIDQFIISTLSPLPYREVNKTNLGFRDCKVALLSAWLTYLRQNVGSCFATAPAILVLTQQPDLFLSDMKEILSSGKLSRTFEGNRFAVPVAESWGMGDLRKQVPLSPSLGRAPGLVLAFVASGLIDENGPFDEKVRQAQLIVNRELKKRLEKGSHWISSQELIRSALCERHQVLEEELESYMDHPELVPSGGVFIRSKEKATNQNPIPLILKAEESAHLAFKCLTDNPLLKAWEFTLASFSETKHDFCRWNLYQSLGMNHDQAGGIAHRLYEVLQEQVEEQNRLAGEHQVKYEQMAVQVQHSLLKLQQSNSEHERVWLRSEYQNAQSELGTIEHARDLEHKKAQAFANLYNFLRDEYDRLFQDYYQEVYDPEMRGVEGRFYEDAPAGFRLVFKHGRQFTASWSPIYDAKGFVESLAQFFTATEHEISSKEELELIQKEFSYVITKLIQHVRSQEFIKFSYARMAEAHGELATEERFKELDNQRITPWAYVSGGTMNALISNYYGRCDSPQIQKAWFSNVEELWVFLIDVMRDIPQWITDNFIENAYKSLLIHSPSHAFLLKPGATGFERSWNNQTYPYTWIRDYYFEPQLDMYHTQLLGAEKQERVLKKALSLNYFPNQKELLKKAQLGSTPYRSSVWREALLKKLKPQLNSDSLRKLSSSLDAALLRSLPFSSITEFKRRACELFNELSSKPIFEDRLRGLLEEELKEYKELDVDAESAVRIIKKVYCRAFGTNYFPSDALSELYELMKQHHLIFQLPVIFADSNWVKDRFAFVVNPGTEKLELWRVEPYSFRGFQMMEWNSSFGSKGNKAEWGVFNSPQQYSIF